jgi:hypothetical protein
MAPYFYRLTRRQKLTFVVLGAAWFICAALQIGTAEPGETPSVVWTILDILGFVVIYFVARMVVRCVRASRDSNEETAPNPDPFVLRHRRGTRRARVSTA